MKIVIDGNIGCGKTTIIKKLNDELRIPIFLEPLHKWDKLLSLFYDDPSKWAFPFNLQVLTDFHEWRHNNFTAVYERSPLSCRHVFTQLNYEMGHIHPEELKIFDKIFGELMWTPDFCIYIQTNPANCMERMTKRGRQCEQNVPLDYLEKVHLKYQELATRYSHKIHIIDGNRDPDLVYKDVLDIVVALQS